MKYPDWNNVKCIASGINWTYEINKSGYYLVCAWGQYGREYIYVNGQSVAFGGFLGNYYLADYNLLLLNKGDIVTASKYDGGSSVHCELYYLPFK